MKVSDRLKSSLSFTLSICVNIYWQLSNLKIKSSFQVVNLKVVFLGKTSTQSVIPSFSFWTFISSKQRLKITKFYKIYISYKIKLTFFIVCENYIFRNKRWNKISEPKLYWSIEKMIPVRSLYHPYLKSNFSKSSINPHQVIRHNIS